MLRPAPNIYAVNENTEVHFLLRSGHPTELVRVYRRAACTFVP